eukprot:CAMPEP_0174902592 /NCGR_PEP_ID=MMETSP0167-20121228/38670_1 /TAXON_ID=38298 /ORGANISM="Rhodella maculata, Strain CCMP736" /LENGTH=163 /DNA_ID=CAMNT_0016144657 /DNA_START=216 /DNA_END=704 /DNA_ORIENTATION=-
MKLKHRIGLPLPLPSLPRINILPHPPHPIPFLPFLAPRPRIRPGTSPPLPPGPSLRAAELRRPEALGRAKRARFWGGHREVFKMGVVELGGKEGWGEEKVVVVTAGGFGGGGRGRSGGSVMGHCWDVRWAVLGGLRLKVLMGRLGRGSLPPVFVEGWALARSL